MEAEVKKFNIKKHTLECIQEYMYIEQLLTREPNHGRIRVGWSPFSRHSRMLSGNLPLPIKRKVNNHCILPVLTYGAETWTIKKQLEKKLATTQRAMQRKLIETRIRDRWTAEWVREQTGVAGMLVDIKRKKWTWIGYVMHRTENRWTLRATDCLPRYGKRSRRRQRVIWSDETEKFSP